MSEIESASARFAHGLLAEKVTFGDVVGLLLPVGASLLVALLGVVRAGAVATVLPVGPGGSGTAAQRLQPLVEASGMRFVVADTPFEVVAGELRLACSGLTVLPVRLAMPGNGALPRIASADLAVVQYTSGSTMAPRGVMLTHANVLAGLSAIAVSAQMTSTDVWVQWTPPYHDLGLFGMSASVLNGGATYAISPRTFIRRPEAFLELVAGVRGTITTGPNFSYDLLIEAARSTGVLDELDLSSWRLAFNGGEQVSASTVETFADVFAIAGVSSSAMYPVYGMAEATLAVSFPAPGSVPTVRWVDRDLLGTAGRAAWIDRTDPRAVGLVCVGSAVSGLQLRVVSAGQGCGDSRLGEIQLRGPAVTSGYYRNEQASSALFDDGWLRTGDLGFRVDDELYVCGRAKEMIIVHGSNYFPTDAEHLARYVPGVYRGRVVAFSDVDSRGGEYIGLIAETDLPSSEHSTLAQEIHRRIAAMLGTGRIRVHLVAPRFLTRSTSGKWQRLAAAQRLAVNHLSFATSSELTK